MFLFHCNPNYPSLFPFAENTLLFPDIHCPLAGQDLLGEVQLPGCIEDPVTDWATLPAFSHPHIELLSFRRLALPK